jgi:UDP-3-O-[3-hydroxymyristoyl] glucosamine N-acyltransferase
MEEELPLSTTTVRALAELVQGHLHGDGDLLITDARSVAEARSGHITLIENDKQLKHLARTQATAAVVPDGLETNGQTVIQAKDPLAAFIAILQHLRGHSAQAPGGIDPRAAIHPSAAIGPDPTIGPFVSVGEGTVVGARCRVYPGVVLGRNCRVGDDAILYPHAVVYDDCVLGNRVIVHAHAVIGADGFGFRHQKGRHVKVPQLGHVEIGDDVEIGACSTIDRGTFDATRVGQGTKIDNLVMIGHNCQIGPHNLLVSQVGIAGSCTTGAYVVMAGQAGVADHVTIGDGAVLGARSGVGNDLKGGARYLGAPALPELEQKRIMVSLYKLPEMRRDLQKIKSQLGINDAA